MTFDELLKRRAIERCRVSPDEIGEHLRVAKHDFGLARSVAAQDLDWAFSIAYNGILQTSLAFMYHQGYRPKGEAKHYNTFRFLAAALPGEWEHDISRLQKLRAKRNLAMYQTRGVVSESEAQDILDFSERFFAEIVRLLPREIVRDSEEES